MSLRPFPSSTSILGLDLMRALAVLLVLLSHWASHFDAWFAVPMPPWIDFLGDLGVELFFALSGFLIGRILIGLVASRPGWEDFRVFLTRRAMRTLPLYFLWLALLLLLFPPRGDAAATALRFATLTQNLAGPMPPDHWYAVTWSLAIEEWFYLLFTGALVALRQWLGANRALSLCLMVFLTVPLTLRLLHGAAPGQVFFRIDEIGYGVLMARLSLRDAWVFRHPRACLLAGLALVLLAIRGLPWAAPWLAAALTPNTLVGGCALCLPAALPLRTAAGWFARPVRWLATRSYALYLVHLTILVDVGENRLWDDGVWPPLPCALLAIVLPFALAELSYRFVEGPLLRRRPRQGKAAARPLPPFNGNVAG